MVKPYVLLKIYILCLIREIVFGIEVIYIQEISDELQQIS